MSRWGKQTVRGPTFRLTDAKEENGYGLFRSGFHFSSSARQAWYSSQC